MGVCGKFTIIAVTSLAVYLGVQINRHLFIYPELPTLEDTWWGAGKAVQEDEAIKPFKIAVSDEVLDDLKQRLKNHRQLTLPLEGTKQLYGINTVLLKKMGEFWLNTYNWREREKFLNQYPQFTTNIQGLKIHYLHVKPKVKPNVRVLPLLILHGWPGSVREFYEIMPLLTTPRDGRDFVFEVIAPSLPGYGFSEAASKPGLGAVQVAVVMKNLMKRIGFDKFYVQGGDWGAVIASHMSTIYPNIILGLHSNMCTASTPLSNLKLFLGSLYPPLIVDEKHASKMYPLSSKFSDLLLETGYLHLQATKPDTIGVALTDSPIGLAAYILEKFSTWTEPAFKGRTDAGLSLKFNYHSLFDNIMIYWVTGSITTSMRLYAETLNKNQYSLGIDRIPIEVPSACARFANELAYSSDSILKEKYKNLVHTSDFPGGHFAAFEAPAVLADDIWTAVGKMESKS